MHLWFLFFFFVLIKEHLEELNTINIVFDALFDGDNIIFKIFFFFKLELLFILISKYLFELFFFS